MTTKLFNSITSQKVINKICSYLCLHDVLRNRILCTTLMKGYQWFRRRLERKFGAIYILGFRIYVSTDKALMPEFSHYFVYREIRIKFPNVILKATRILRMESLTFVNTRPGEWSLNMPTTQGKIKAFKFDGLVPARLDYYVSKIILDSGSGLAIVAHEARANYFYYDSVETGNDSRIYIKKLTVYDPISRKKKEVIRKITCYFPKDYEGINKLTEYVSGTIEKMPYKQLAKMTFVADPINGKALMFEKFNVGSLFFLDSDTVCTTMLGSLYRNKTKRMQCKNK